MRVTGAIFIAVLCSTLISNADAVHSAERISLSDLPLAAQARIFAILGHENLAHQVRAQADGFQAGDPHHGLASEFTAKGVEVRSGASTWRMRVSSLGYGVRLHPAGAAFPEGRLNRVQYQRAGLTEWYINGPKGMEQGFTVDRAPGHGDGTPLTIALTTDGNLTAVEDGHKGLSLVDQQGKTRMRYTGLAAQDVAGNDLPAWIELRAQQVMIRVDDRGAQYPIVIDPWMQTAELTAADGAPDDELGWSVAISGNTVVVGAPFHAVGSNPAQGAAYVFVRPGNSWADMTQTAELLASDGAANAYFGSSVAISGNTVLVGAGGTTVNSDPLQGAAYVFVQPAEGWSDMTETAKLTASDGAANDILGVSVAISHKTIVAGAPEASVGGETSAGAAYVFIEPASGWADATQIAKLTASDAMPHDYFGSSVTVQGNIIVVGAPSDYSGAVYVFVRPAGRWTDATQTAELTVTGGSSQLLLGTSVALSGNVVVSGAVGVGGGGNQNQGALFVFVEPESGWTDMNQSAQLASADGTGGDYFGRSLSISGNTGVAGAPFHRTGSNDFQGAGYLFQTVNPHPQEIALSPDSAVMGDLGFALTVSGSDFVHGSVVNWSGSPRTTRYLSADEVQADILASDVAAAGKARVTVTNPLPGGGSSNGLTFTVNNPVPTLAALVPDSVTAGGPRFTLTINGANFVARSKVQGNGISLETTFVSSTELTAIVPAEVIKQGATIHVSVVNPTPGGGRSNALTFTVNNPIPTLTKLEPASAKAGDSAFTLLLTGTSFVPDSKVYWNGHPRQTTYVGKLKLQAQILASDIAKPHSVAVTVANPTPEGGNSNPLTFTVNP